MDLDSSLSQHSARVKGSNSSHWQQQDYQWDPFQAIATKLEAPNDNHATNFRRVSGGREDVDYGLYNVDETGTSKQRVGKLECQVCETDLSECSFYFRRYKVCVEHARANFVYFHQCQQRFCNRCGRFHPVNDFDENKRSCRLRLDKHNERRRQKRAENKIIKQSSGSIGRVSKPSRTTPIDVEKVVDAIAASENQLHFSSESQKCSVESNVDSCNKSQWPVTAHLDCDHVSLEDKSLPDATFMQQYFHRKCKSSGQKSSLSLQDMPYILGVLKSMDKHSQFPDHLDLAQLPFAKNKELCSPFSSAFALDTGGHHTRSKVVDSASSWDFAQSSKQMGQQLPVQDSLSTFSLPQQLSEPALPFSSSQHLLPSSNLSQQGDYEEFHSMIDQITGVQQDNNEFIPLHRIPSFAEKDFLPDVVLDSNSVSQMEDLQNEMNLILQEDFPAKLYNYTVKLFNTTPDKLEKSLRDQLVQAMQQGDNHLEMCMRAGCIELRIFGINFKCNKHPSYEEVIQVLLGNNFWREQTFLLHDNDACVGGVHHAGISHVVERQYQEAERHVKLDSISPKILTPGDALVVEGRHLEGSEVLARMNGTDVVLEIEEGMDEFATLIVPTDCSSGLLKLQFSKNNWFSNVLTVVVLNDNFEDTNEVFQDLGLLESVTECEEKETSFLIQLGLLLDYQSQMRDTGEAVIQRKYNHLECKLLCKFNIKILIEAVKNSWTGVFNWAMDLFASNYSSSKEAVDNLESNFNGNVSLLHLAVNTGNLGALKVIYNWGNKNNYTWSCLCKAAGGFTPMHFAALLHDGGLIARLLVQLFPHGLLSISTPADDSKTTPLLFSKIKGQPATFEAMKLLHIQYLSLCQKYNDADNTQQQHQAPVLKQSSADNTLQQQPPIQEQSCADNTHQHSQRTVCKQTSNKKAGCVKDRRIARWDSDRQDDEGSTQVVVRQDINPINSLLSDFQRDIFRWDSASSQLKRNQSVNQAHSQCQAQDKQDGSHN